MKKNNKIKQCTYCLKKLPATIDYFRKSYNNQGLEARCRECQKDRIKKYKQKQEPYNTWMNGSDEIYI